MCKPLAMQCRLKHFSPIDVRGCHHAVIVRRSRLSAAILTFIILTLSRKRASLSYCPVLSTLNIKWSLTRPSLTLPLNSSCRRHSRDTVSLKALRTTALCFPMWSCQYLSSSASSSVTVSIPMTPFGKHRANFRASVSKIGFVISMSGSSR